MFDRLKLLVDLGLTGREPITVGGYAGGRADWGIDGSALVIGGGDDLRPGNSAVHSLAVTITP